MIIDACKAAEAAGVDFKIYDTDNDGILDNVFVFYAGYNEAEGGADETVWPHRWSLSNSSSTVSGKIIFDYACTSELRGRTGNPATPIWLA
jgi:immune inhibitor A